MANEITVTAELKVAKVGRRDGISFGPSSFSFILASPAVLHNTQSVAVAGEALILGEISAGGWCMMRNNDATNYVSVLPGTGLTPLVKLKAGECALFRLHQSATAPFVQADTNTVEIEYLLMGG